MFFSRAAALAVLAASADAIKGKNTFAVLRFNDNSLVSGRADPIVNPGAPSGHVHLIQGGNAFALDMADDAPLKSTCTSAKINRDFSNYWTPSLYFKDPKTGQLESVELFYQNVYYFFEAEKEEVHPFPLGLRILVGNPFARTPPSTAGSFTDNSRGVIQPIQWVCPRSNPSTPLYPANSDGLHGVGIQDPQNAGAGVGFPDKECDGYASPLRADIHMPSCYDSSKGLRNYKENMQWPTNGVCPPGTLHVPHLFFEVYWNTPKFAGRWTPGQGNSPWVLSNGDPTGYGLHADFLAGWDTQTLQAIIDTCDAGSSGMDNCPNIPGGKSNDGKCHIDNPVPETIFGTMSKLPGNNPVGQWGVAAAPPAAASSAASSSAAAATTKAAAQPTTTKAAAPATTSKSAAGNVYVPPSSSKAAVVQSAPVASSKPAPTTTKAATTAKAPTTTKAAVSDKLVTSYVVETETIWRTVTVEYPAPSAKAAPAGWTYKGCFSDNTAKRVLTGIQFADIGNKQVTSTKCVAYCQAKGFSIAGTEFGGQCFCGNKLVGSGKIAESKCAMKCEGNAKETCGGPDALSVYEKAGVKKTRQARHMHRHLNGLSH